MIHPRLLTGPTLAAGLLAAFAGAAKASPYEIPDLDAASGWEVKIQAESKQSRDERSVEGPILDLTAPIRPGLETSLTFGRAWARTPGGPTYTGVTDTEVAVKWELARQGEHGSGVYVTTEPSVFVPTGSKGLTEDHWRIEVPLIVGRTFGPWAVRGMVAYGRNLDGPADGEVSVAGLVTYDLSEHFQLGAELATEAPSDLIGDYGATANFGFSWEALEGLEVQGRIGRTVREAPGSAPATTIALYVEKAF